jgi:hypothetical protein
MVAWHPGVLITNSGTFGSQYCVDSIPTSNYVEHVSTLQLLTFTTAARPVNVDILRR